MNKANIKSIRHAQLQVKFGYWKPVIVKLLNIVPIKLKIAQEVGVREIKHINKDSQELVVNLVIIIILKEMVTIVFRNYTNSCMQKLGFLNLTYIANYYFEFILDLFNYLRSVKHDYEIISNKVGKRQLIIHQKQILQQLYKQIGLTFTMFMNYLQILSIILNFNVDLPQNSFNLVDNSQYMLLISDCILDDNFQNEIIQVKIFFQYFAHSYMGQSIYLRIENIYLSSCKIQLKFWEMVRKQRTKKKDFKAKILSNKKYLYATKENLKHIKKKQKQNITLAKKEQDGVQNSINIIKQIRKQQYK